MSLDVVRVGFAPPVGEGLIDYDDAWTRQRQTHEQVALGTAPDTVLLLEHSPVYTAGKRTNSWERPTDGTPVIDVDRGGRITWHGPGQIVGYPILRLADPIDVVAYVRRLEQLLMDVCTELGVTTQRVDGRSGVWVPADRHGPDRKVAAIGVRVARGVTMHGFALNVDNSLDPFHVIVPCGITDAEATTLAIERERLGLTTVSIGDVLPLVEQHVPSLVASSVVAA
ncbi:MAG TPA: lipoyl(octanoyl) transferase LipB [Actinomycetes bacterium]|nr:lipoyl(octanoyl) transferase LipB [Actinomycetes bacterium]